MSIQGLEEGIERLVREHMVAVQSAAAAAVARALAASMTPPSSVRAKGRQTPPTPRRPTSRRRGPDEVAELAERFCAAVHAAPGETMATLAAEVGATARELAVPVKRLRSAGRVRTVGERQYTKYFPAAPS